jgi:hypothetical protein
MCSQIFHPNSLFIFPSEFLFYFILEILNISENNRTSVELAQGCMVFLMGFGFLNLGVKADTFCKALPSPYLSITIRAILTKLFNYLIIYKFIYAS